MTITKFSFQPTLSESPILGCNCIYSRRICSKYTQIRFRPIWHLSYTARQRDVAYIGIELDSCEKTTSCHNRHLSKSFQFCLPVRNQTNSVCMWTWLPRSPCVLHDALWRQHVSQWKHFACRLGRINNVALPRIYSCFFSVNIWLIECFWTCAFESNLMWYKSNGLNALWSGYSDFFFRLKVGLHVLGLEWTEIIQLANSWSLSTADGPFTCYELSQSDHRSGLNRHDEQFAWIVSFSNPIHCLVDSVKLKETI